MSEFFIYQNGIREGVLQDWESVQWLENYGSPGEVKIVAYATEENKKRLVDGTRIYNTDTDTVARISHTDITESEDEQGVALLTARADITSELLSDCVVMATETIRNVEAGMYSIYSKNRDGMPIAVGTAQGYTETADMQITWGSVLEAEQKLAEVSGLGFKVTFDPETAIETFRVYKGTDRSKDTSPDYVGYFGTDAGNISKITITRGTTDYKNIAVVAGEDKSVNRKVRIVSLGTFIGEERRKLFVDAKDLQSEYQVATDTGEKDEHGNPIYSYETRTYTTAEYNALLDARGFEKLAEHVKHFSITCDINQSDMQYGVDYFLGDRMPLKLPEYGITTTAIVSAVLRVYEKEGNRTVASLSDFELEAA